MYNKIINGNICQHFNDYGECVGQEFFPIQEAWEQEGMLIDWTPQFYYPYDLIQPENN